MKRLGFALLGAATALAQQMNPTRISEYPSPLVREEQEIVVDGENEIWQLQWAMAPKPACGPSEVSLTCPCTGFAYGETGDLFLVRVRGGAEIDRLRLGTFFKPEEPTFQRWEPDYEGDFKASERDDFIAVVSRRPTVQLMHLADYDHDGTATEFYVQMRSLPCGKSYGVVVGLSRINPRLHAFSTISKPAEPLYLQQREWEALRDASGPIEVVDWDCGDHGADREARLRLRWTSGGVDGVRQEYECPPTRDQRPVKEEPL